LKTYAQLSLTSVEECIDLLYIDGRQGISFSGMCFFALSLFLSNITRKRYFLSNITRKRELLSYSYSLLYNFRYRCLMVLTMPNGSGVVLSSFRRNWGKKSDHFATECV